MEILIFALIVRDLSVQTEVLINTLDHVILRTKSLMFQHHMKEMTTMQMIKHPGIQILRFQIFQLFHCHINGAIMKIACLREIYLSLTKK